MFCFSINTPVCCMYFASSNINLATYFSLTHSNLLKLLLGSTLDSPTPSGPPKFEASSKRAVQPTSWSQRLARLRTRHLHPNSELNTLPQPITAFSLPLGPSHHFQVDRNHYTSLNRSSLPCNLPSYVDMSQSPSPTQLCSRLWSADHYPYLAFSLQFPFVNQWARFATPVDLIHDHHGWHLPCDTQKEWKNFEHIIWTNAEKISEYLKTWFSEFDGLWDEPEKPGLYG